MNRIVRVRERCADLFGHMGSRVRVIRTSNGYQFNDPKGAASKGFPSKSDFPSGTSIQDFPSSLAAPCPTRNRPLDSDLGAALLRFKAAFDRQNRKRRLRKNAERLRRNISLEENSEPLRGLCPCAFCAASRRGRTAAQARRRLLGEARSRGDGGPIGTDTASRETRCP